MGFWDGYTEGQQAANTTLNAPIQRQSALEALQSTRQQNAMNDIKLNQQQFPLSLTFNT